MLENIIDPIVLNRIDVAKQYVDKIISIVAEAKSNGVDIELELKNFNIEGF